jgi:hypothetical protein
MSPKRSGRVCADPVSAQRHFMPRAAQGMAIELSFEAIMPL